MSAQEPVLFRASKKRKIYRQRADDEPSIPEPVPASPAAKEQSIEELISSAVEGGERQDREGDGDDQGISIAEILRARNSKKQRRGVEFRVQGLGAREEDESALVVARQEKQEKHWGHEIRVEGGLSAKKFAPQMGVVGDVADKHMMAYVDSKIAKRRLSEKSPSTPSGQTSTQIQDSVADSGEKSLVLRDGNKRDVEVQRQPAALGKLLEIDLGDEARDRNVERTNMARRRLVGEDVEEVEGSGKGKGKGKVRLGRDGKPWRGRKRRGSDDVKRDQLVDQVLRENRLEIYDEPLPDPQTPDDDQAADDRIAEAFRQEFMDAVSERQRKKSASTQNTQQQNRGAAGKREEELMKGPKLGGSRNA
ncbi:hypothetical protein B7494_g8164, partial [Chlorociboria aeruginascens]